MRGAWLVLVGWGTLLAVLAAPQLSFSPLSGELALGFGAAGLVVAVGFASLLTERRGTDPRPTTADEPQVAPTASPASVLIGIGVALMVLGWAFGAFLIYIAGGVLALALFGVAREVRGQRA